ncbi:MAG: hypothetical protein OXR73_26710 [Myxococcales bacterium]|nr:hypothetical protein [Myxococcales bacterium]
MGITDCALRLAHPLRTGRRGTMEVRVARLLAWLLLLSPLVLAVVSCDEDSDGPSAETCQPGETEPCTCMQENTGMRLCLGDGSYSSCSCAGPASGSCGVAGRELTCTCEEGGRGTQVCLASGDTSACRCPQMAPVDEGPPTDMATLPVQSLMPDVVADAGTPMTDPQPAPSERCCHDLGTCLASEALPASSADGLARDTCDDPSTVCLPDRFADVAGFTLPSCRSFGFAEGRCVPDCLPGMDDLIGVAPRDLCPEHHLCVACFDPFTGEDTGACKLSNDRGPSEPGVLFGSCCGERGECMPEALLPAGPTDMLARDTCDPDRDLMCVPAPFAEPGGFALPSCRAPGDLEGRCVPACLPTVADQAELLSQSTCGDDERCVPCHDPFSGEATGICSLSNDPGPAEPIATFDRCCHDLGTCLPAETVPSETTSSLGPDTCASGASALCVPDSFAAAAGFALQTCRALGFAEGRCVPDCLPQVSELVGVAPRDLCPDHHLCVGCFDPFTGDSTGVCELSNDPGPTESPVLFGACCLDRGTCVPEQLVPEEERTLLSTDTCDERLGLLCVPDPLGEQEGFSLPSCRAVGDLEGRCAPSCLPSVAALADQLTQGSCQADERCVPCYDPISGAPTGMCGLSNDPGPSEPPVIFPRCCDQGAGPVGVCLPDAFLPQGAAEELPQETCPTAELHCTPMSLTEAPGSSFPACNSGGGACVPECIIDTSLAGLLPQDVCANTELCVPCSVLGQATGVCF